MFGFLGRCPYYSMFRTFIVNELFLRMMGFLDIGKLGKDHCEITTKFQKRLDSYLQATQEATRGSRFKFIR